MVLPRRQRLCETYRGSESGVAVAADGEAERIRIEVSRRQVERFLVKLNMYSVLFSICLIVWLLSLTRLIAALELWLA